jgi:hypothetical protein
MQCEAGLEEKPPHASDYLYPRGFRLGHLAGT